MFPGQRDIIPSACSGSAPGLHKELPQLTPFKVREQQFYSKLLQDLVKVNRDFVIVSLLLYLLLYYLRRFGLPYVVRRFIAWDQPSGAGGNEIVEHGPLSFDVGKEWEEWFSNKHSASLKASLCFK